jgi:hypothetical protein
MAKAIKKAAMGIDVKPKAGQKTPTKSKPLDKPTKRYKTPADFYPESYDKRFPRTPGGGDNYGTTIEMEKERVKKGLPAYKKGGKIAKQAATAIAMKKAGKTPKKK